MRILAINQFYAPDMSATSQLLTQLCEDLVAVGDEVTVLASRGSYLGGEPLPPREYKRGVQVVRPWATTFGRGSIARRLSDYGSFWVGAVAQAARLARPDVILALTTPPMIAAGAAIVAKVRAIPLVTWVQDVYPEVAIALGVLEPQRPATRIFSALSTATHRRSRFSVALSQGMAARLEAQGQRRGRIRVVSNWSDGEALFPVPRERNHFRREYGLSDRFVVMYSGNLGLGHDVTTLLGAAARLERRAKEVEFVFVGDGGRLHEAKRLAAGLTNTRFLPYQPLSRLGDSLSAADVHLASLRDGLQGLLVPSKLYGILAVGRPLMYVGPPDCEVARVVTTHDLGWTGPPGNVDGLADAIATAAASPAETAARGERARTTFLQRYDRRLAVPRWRAVLEEAVSS